MMTESYLGRLDLLISQLQEQAAELTRVADELAWLRYQVEADPAYTRDIANHLFSLDLLARDLLSEVEKARHYTEAVAQDIEMAGLYEEIKL